MKNENEKNKETDDKLNFYFQEIEKYFKQKEKILLAYKHVPLEEILEDAPRHYTLIRLIERFNIFLSKNKSWLKQFIDKRNINFDWLAYERWKSGKHFVKYRYTDTRAPSKWVHILQDYFIDLLEYLQILLIMEFCIDEADYKEFLNKNPKIKYRIQANYVISSLPSENIEKIFDIINFLLKVNIEHNFTINFIIDTSVCMNVYRKIDSSGIFDLLKRKEFYIKNRLEYLKKTHIIDRANLPYENDVIKVAENFLEALKEFRFTYSGYKGRLIDKYEKVRNKKK